MKRLFFSLALLVGVVGCTFTDSVVVRSELPAVMFVGAHPDDSEGFAGLAFLLKGKYDLHIVDYTNGDFGLGEAGFADGTTARLRQAEERDACELLAATPHFVGEVDSRALVTRESVDELVRLIRELKPVAIFTHWPIDGHVDHVMTAAATSKAMKEAKFHGESYYYEVIPSETRNWRPLYSVDISEVMHLKTEMMRRYRCQNEDDWLAQDKLKQAAARGQERRPSVAFAETFTTYNGKPLKRGILHNLEQTALVKE